jgi:hypothetical protein
LLVVANYTRKSAPPQRFRPKCGLGKDKAEPGHARVRLEPARPETSAGKSIRSVNACVSVETQSLDLVFYLQFSPLEFHDFKVIDRWMGQAFIDFVFECLMSFLQFRKVRLHRHAVCLLNQWLSTM